MPLLEAVIDLRSSVDVAALREENDGLTRELVAARVEVERLAQLSAKLSGEIVADSSEMFRELDRLCESRGQGCAADHGGAGGALRHLVEYFNGGDASAMQEELRRDAELDMAQGEVAGLKADVASLKKEVAGLRWEESQRQMALLAFAQLALINPGLDYLLGEMAESLRGRAMFEEFKALRRPRTPGPACTDPRCALHGNGTMREGSRCPMAAPGPSVAP